MAEPNIRFCKNDGSAYPDWEEKLLSDVASRITRKNKKNETDIPLTIASIEGLVDQRTYFGKTIASKDMSGYYLLKKGEFAYNKSYSKGYDYGSIKRLDNYDMGALSTLYICFALNAGENSDFFSCYFNGLSWYNQMQEICAEGARNHGLLNVSANDFFNITLSIPSSNEERQRIADFFEHVDSLIIASEQEVNKLLELKKGYLQKMFPKDGASVPEVRFPGFTDAWEQHKCIEIFDKVGTPVEVEAEEVYREIGIRSHGKGIFHKDGVTGYELGSKRVFWVEPNCFVLNIVFAWERAVAKTTENENGMIASHRFPMYKPKAGVVDLDFITKFFTTNKGKEILEMASPGGAGRNRTLGQKEFANSELLLPCYDEQKKIGQFLNDFDNLITLHQIECEKYKELKKGLLQQMFV